MSAVAAPAPGRVRVDIFGEAYTVRGEESGTDADYIATLARTVDERMRELAARAPGMAKHRLAVLVAMNLADELAQSRVEEPAVDNEVVVQKTRYLIGLLDEGIVGDAARTRF